MKPIAKNRSAPASLVLGFLAGFLATLTFHQTAVAVLWALKLVWFRPFSMASTWPFGVPEVLSLAFWGGIWGIAYAFADRRFPVGAGYWLGAFLFGGILPSLVALFIVVPLRGGPLGGGLNPGLWLVALFVNGCWGVGTGLFLRGGRRILYAK